jgi:hypothetical protein
MTTPVDPGLAAAQSAAAAAWAAANAARAQVIGTYVAAAGSFLVAVVTGVLTFRESLRGRNARRFAAVEGLRSAAGMIAVVWSSVRATRADQVVPFERLKAFLKIATDGITSSAAQNADDRQIVSLIHRLKRSTDGLSHLIDRVERAKPRLKTGEFLRDHGDWEAMFTPLLEEISKLTG